GTRDRAAWRPLAHAAQARLGRLGQRKARRAAAVAAHREAGPAGDGRRGDPPRARQFTAAGKRPSSALTGAGSAAAPASSTFSQRPEVLFGTSHSTGQIRSR